MISEQDLIQLQKDVSGIKSQLKELKEKIERQQPGFSLENLPPHYKQITDTLEKIGLADAEKIGEIVGKERATCSALLNSLELAGFVRSMSCGRNKFFALNGGLL